MSAPTQEQVKAAEVMLNTLGPIGLAALLAEREAGLRALLSEAREALRWEVESGGTDHAHESADEKAECEQCTTLAKLDAALDPAAVAKGEK